jgi:RAT1-interacting protein
MSSWGYKFEQHLTAADPGSRPDIRQPVNENEEFCCMFRSRVGGLSLVYGAEMDAYTGGSAVPPGDPLSPDRFVEMKTSREVETDKQARTFRRFKTLKWWAQSFLVGTPEVLCGWRDDDGVVWRLETFKVKDLPKAGEEWRPNICFNFLTALLQELQARLAGDGLDTVWEVAANPDTSDFTNPPR